MADRRHSNINWRLNPANADGVVSNETVTHALLMDIRDELQKLNQVFTCHNFQNIPTTLKRIDRRLQRKGMKV